MTIEVTNTSDSPEYLRPMKPPVETCDTTVGLVIEGRHEWHEYCTEHGESYLRINPSANWRRCSLYEVLVSWREYRCQACCQLLWDRNERDQ